MKYSVAAKLKLVVDHLPTQSDHIPFPHSPSNSELIHSEKYTYWLRDLGQVMGHGSLQPDLVCATRTNWVRSIVVHLAFGICGRVCRWVINSLSQNEAFVSYSENLKLTLKFEDKSKCSVHFHEWNVLEFLVFSLSHLSKHTKFLCMGTG